MSNFYILKYLFIRFYRELMGNSKLAKKKANMFTNQFFDLLLNFDNDWQGQKVETDYKISDINIVIVLLRENIPLSIKD